MSDDFALEDLPQPTFVGSVSPDELSTDGDNPNEQSDEMFGLLCDRIRERGWLGGPIIADSDGMIADGEHRYLAAKEIGLEEDPVEFYDFDDATRRMVRQELNKIHGEHDRKRDALEYDYLLGEGWTEEVNEIVEAAGEDLDEILAELRLDNSRPAAYDYDPEHNVYFEDCVEGMRERLADDSVDCVITDPPYGVNVHIGDTVGKTVDPEHRERVAGDQDEEEALDLWKDVMAEVNRVSTEQAHLYCFASWKTYGKFKRVIEGNGWRVLNCLVWVKKDATQMATFGPHNKWPRYAYKHEFVIFASRSDEQSLEGNPDDVFEYTEARWADVDDQVTQHPTQKPLDFLVDLIQNSTTPGDTVLDPFMGSGTTAVAAIQNGRDYVGFEIDAENYREVIERRIGEAKRQREAGVNQEAADD